MLLLPKGNPLFENLTAARLKLPEVLSKLSNGIFTGYASFVFQTSTAILVFESGRLASALFEEQNGRRQTGPEALSSLVRLILTSGSGTLSVYKLSKDLTTCIHALLEGETLYRAQELKLIDINLLLSNIRNDRMDGCLRIYTDQHSTMIFYKEGNPLGFFHDGSSEIETSSSESQKIAGMPGAKIDLYSTSNSVDSIDVNLLESIDIASIWDASVTLYRTETDKSDMFRGEREREAISLKLSELEENIKKIVSEHMGKVGRGVVEKVLSDNGGNSCLSEEAGVAKLLSSVERAARLLISGTNIRLMQEKLSAVTASARSEQIIRS